MVQRLCGGAAGIGEARVDVARVDFDVVSIRAAARLLRAAAARR